MVADMYPTVRGLLEQLLDSELTDENLLSSFNLFKSLKDRDLIDSIESAMISQIYTRVNDLGKELSEHDDELFALFLSRSEVIKTRVREVCIFELQELARNL